MGIIDYSFYDRLINYLKFINSTWQRGDRGDLTLNLLHQLIRDRRSSRAIDPSKPVEIEKILSLLEAARWAPSCFNNQPWQFIVSRGASLDKVKNCLSRGNSWAKRAPLIFTIGSKPDLGCQITGRDYYPLDN